MPPVFIFYILNISKQKKKKEEKNCNTLKFRNPNMLPWPVWQSLSWRAQYTGKHAPRNCATVQIEYYNPKKKILVA